MSLEQTIALLSKGEVKQALAIMKKDAEEFKDKSAIQFYNAFAHILNPNSPHKENFKDIAKIYYELLLLPYRNF